MVAVGAVIAVVDVPHDDNGVVAADVTETKARLLLLLMRRIINFPTKQFVCRLGSFINHIMLIWMISDPLPPFQNTSLSIILM